MNIREARYSDIAEMVNIGLRVFEESPAYAQSSYNQEKVAAFIQHLIDTPQIGCALLAEEDGVIAGGILGLLYQDWFGDDITAIDLIFYIQPEFRGGSAAVKLIRAYEQHARHFGANRVLVGSTYGMKSDQVGSLFERIGFEHIGSNYMKGAS